MKKFLACQIAQIPLCAVGRSRDPALPKPLIRWWVTIACIHIISRCVEWNRYGSVELGMSNTAEVKFDQKNLHKTLKSVFSNSLP